MTANKCDCDVDAGMKHLSYCASLSPAPVSNDKATARPWSAMEGTDGRLRIEAVDLGPEDAVTYGPVVARMGLRSGKHEEEANARLIIDRVNGWDELVKERDSLIAERDQLKAEVAALKVGREALTIAAVEAKNIAWMKGFISGLTEYAWWKDGTEYVGTCGTTLKAAIERAKKEYGGGK